MEKKNPQAVSSQIREALTKAQKIRGADQLCIDAIKDIVKKEPAFMQAREKLRAVEKRKAIAGSKISKFFANLAALLKVSSIKPLVEQEPLQAMAKCEDLLAGNLDNPLVLRLLAEAALNAGAPFIAVEALAIAREYHPANETVLRALASAMQQNEQAAEAVQVFKEIAARHPGDLGVQSELRAAMAVASMARNKQSGEAEDAGQSAVVVSEKDLLQQLLDGSIHDAVQARKVIEYLTEEVAKKESAEYRRKLAEAYNILGDYDNVIEQYEKVAASLGNLDPFVDKQIEAAVIARFNVAVKELKAHPENYDEPEKQIADCQTQSTRYALSRARERAKVYPNDAQLNYEYAIKLFCHSDINDAIACFQVAGRSPQRKVDCMIYLGRCFYANGQFDMATDELRNALAALDPADGRVLEAMYHLGCVLESAGKGEEAFDMFKNVYQKQANYLDVAARIQKYYSKTE